MSNTSDMVSVLSGISSDQTVIHNEAKRKISILDAAKNPYFKATKNLDQVIHDQITEVNDTIYAVKSAYDERIDSQGCRTDLFWRVTGVSTATQSSGGGAGSISTSYTMTCTRLSVTYPRTVAGSGTTATSDAQTGIGFTTNALLIWDGASTFTSYPMEAEGDSLVSTGSGMDAFLEPDNLHGIKMYVEPHSRDVFDTFRSTGIGTIGIGTTASNNFMTILAPSSTMDIKPGYIMTPQTSGYFASQSVTVTGVGTTAVGLSTYPFTGITTTAPVVCPYITVDQLPIIEIKAPDDNGDYVEMVFTQDPSTIDDSYALDIDANPYVNQTIEIMKYNRAGAGVSIKYTNSGISSGTREWNKFYDGFPDPDDLETIVSEPPLGAGKIHYRVGFDKQPMNGGSPASEGDVVTYTKALIPFQAGYQNLPSCNDSDLNSKISERNTAESNLASDNDFDAMIDTSNAVKTKLNNEYNLRIWAYRMQIGESTNKLADFQSFDSLISNSKFADIMNQE